MQDLKMQLLVLCIHHGAHMMKHFLLFRCRNVLCIDDKIRKNVVSA